MTSHSHPFQGDEGHATVGPKPPPWLDQPLPETRQEAAIQELHTRLAALQQRRARLLSDYDLLEQRVARYEANHPNL